jgi:hypothetical protein
LGLKTSSHASQSMKETGKGILGKFRPDRQNDVRQTTGRKKKMTSQQVLQIRMQIMSFTVESN